MLGGSGPCGRVLGEAVRLMTNPPIEQLFQALVFLSAGIAAGVVYDVCRALRRCCGRGVKLWADILFSVGVCGGLFVLGMLVADGQLRLFMTVCTLCGGAAYSAVCSELTVPLLTRGVRALLRILSIPRVAVEAAKKFLKTRKKLFPKRKDWVKIYGYSFILRHPFRNRTPTKEGRSDDCPKDLMDRAVHHFSDDGLRPVEYRSGTAGPDAGGGIPLGAHTADAGCGCGNGTAGAGDRNGRGQRSDGADRQSPTGTGVPGRIDFLRRGITPRNKREK